MTTFTNNTFVHATGNRLVGLCVTLVALTGCVSPSAPNHDARFGDVARTLRAQQTIDAAAPGRNTDLAPVDGKAAAGAQKKYAESHGYTVKESTPAEIRIPTQAAR